MRKNSAQLGLASLLALSTTTFAGSAELPFATRVMSYDPAPGQFVNNAAFNDPSRALGAPVGGGTAAANNSSVVTLGSFGGSLTLGFDHRLANNPTSSFNPQGLDFIAFGNAFWVGNPNRKWAEPALVEVSRDDNHNGLADDAWYVIPGSHLPLIPADARVTQTWQGDTTPTPPYPASWIPAARLGNGDWSVTTYRLPADPFQAGSVLANPYGDAATTEGIWGYAECSPTLRLGDTSWPNANPDNVVDNATITAEEFYTRPDDPHAVGITLNTAGGDAFDISWAVDPLTGLPANLDGIDFVRFTSAVLVVNASGSLGEVSPEIDAVAEVRLFARADFNHLNGVTVQDIFDFLTAWLAGE